MISPELLRRYPFFAELTDAQLKEIAMHAEEIEFTKGEVIFKEGDPSTKLYVLVDGAVDLYYVIKIEGQPKIIKEYLVGQLNPGEPFGLSSMIEPYRVSTLARVESPVSHVLVFDAMALRALCLTDNHAGYVIMMRIATAFQERLHFTRADLVGARG